MFLSYVSLPLDFHYGKRILGTGILVISSDSRLQGRSRDGLQCLIRPIVSVVRWTRGLLDGPIGSSCHPPISTPVQIVLFSDSSGLSLSV